MISAHEVMQRRLVNASASVVVRTDMHELSKTRELAPQNYALVKDVHKETEQNETGKTVVPIRAAFLSTATESKPSDQTSQVRDMIQNVFSNSEYGFPRGDFPTFDISEIIIGKCLGNGGFSNVAEIRKIRCSENRHCKALRRSDSMAIDNHESRAFIAKHCVRASGDARYAIKRLKSDILKNDEDRLLGIADLVIETRFLSNLEHPNIIKLRGIANVNPFSTEYFVMLDRLYDTLKQRMRKWKQHSMDLKAVVNWIFRPASRKKFWQVRLAMALDLACAFEYLHEKKIIHRDIKPDNIGFDIRGDIKIFDFGMARDLIPLRADQDELYHLTKMSGSLRYMAPEVGLGKPYNEKCDVYSYTMVLWEMLSLSGRAHCHITNEAMFCEEVFEKNSRPPVKRDWSNRLQNLLQDGWDRDHTKRPTMTQIQNTLLAELQSQTMFEHSCDVKRRRSTYVYSGEAVTKTNKHEIREEKSKEISSLASSFTTRSSTFSFSGRSE